MTAATLTAFIRYKCRDNLYDSAHRGHVTGGFYLVNHTVSQKTRTLVIFSNISNKPAGPV